MGKYHTYWFTRSINVVDHNLAVILSTLISIIIVC
jgi:hypothetical protein